jgi:hypothetical protein
MGYGPHFFGHRCYLRPCALRVFGAPPNSARISDEIHLGMAMRSLLLKQLLLATGAGPAFAFAKTKMIADERGGLLAGVPVKRRQRGGHRSRWGG